MSSHNEAGDLQQAVLWSLENKEYTDLLIRCDKGQYKFLVHKNVVCPQCKFFQNSCKKEWEKTTIYKNSPITVVELPEDSFIAVCALLEFLYRQKYSNPPRLAQNSPDTSWKIGSAYMTSELSCHVKIHAIADKYDIAVLGAYACSRFSRSLCKIKMDHELNNIIRDIYNSTEPSNRIRDEIINHLVKHRKKWIMGDDDKLTELIAELPEFGRDLAKNLCRRGTIMRSKLGGEKLDDSSDSDSD